MHACMCAGRASDLTGSSGPGMDLISDLGYASDENI